MFWKRCRCGGLPRLVELFIAAEGPFSAVQERRAQAWMFHFTFRSNCLSKTLRHNASFSVYCFIANTHSPATSSLKQRPCLGLQARQRRAQSLTTFLHVTKHITKPGAQKNVNSASATIQEASAAAALFRLSHLPRRCQTRVISSRRRWLTDSIHSNLHPTNFQMLGFHFGYNGYNAGKGEDKPRSVKSASGAWKHRNEKCWIQVQSSCRLLFSTRVLLRVYFKRFYSCQVLWRHTHIL